MLITEPNDFVAEVHGRMLLVLLRRTQDGIAFNELRYNPLAAERAGVANPAVPAVTRKATSRGQSRGLCLCGGVRPSNQSAEPFVGSDVLSARYAPSKNHHTRRWLPLRRC